MITVSMSDKNIKNKITELKRFHAPKFELDLVLTCVSECVTLLSMSMKMVLLLRLFVCVVIEVVVAFDC